MKLSLPVLLLASLLLMTSGILPGFSQAPSAPVVPPVKRRALIAAPNSQTPAAPETLSKNYLVTFSATANGKAVGELTMLTCSPQISVSGPLDSGPSPTTFGVAGELGEDEGLLLFTYNIDFSYPVVTAVVAGAAAPPQAVPAPGNPRSMAANVQYQQHRSQGMLRMKVGTPYEVLKAAGVTYTVVISAPVDK